MGSLKWANGPGGFWNRIEFRLQVQVLDQGSPALHSPPASEQPLLGSVGVWDCWAACSDHGIDFQVQAFCWSNQKGLARRVQPPRRWLLRASLVGRSDKTWCNNSHFTGGISLENQTTRQYSDGPALASRSCHSLFFSWGCHLDNLCGVTLCPAHATCVKIIQTGRF